VSEQAIVIYDDDCGFCRFTLALLLDRDRGALRPLPLGTAEADYLLHDLTPAERSSSGAEQLSFDAVPTRLSAGAALAPVLRFLPRGRRLGWLLARLPVLTERTYRWVADHRRPIGRLVPRKARRWADRVIAEHGGPVRG
jgi:predicted DCC family thiol-disulfide oxidoreductase YuxK